MQIAPAHSSLYPQYAHSSPYPAARTPQYAHPQYAHPQLFFFRLDLSRISLFYWTSTTFITNEGVNIFTWGFWINANGT